MIFNNLVLVFWICLSFPSQFNTHLIDLNAKGVNSKPLVQGLSHGSPHTPSSWAQLLLHVIASPAQNNRQKWKHSISPDWMLAWFPGSSRAVLGFPQRWEDVCLPVSGSHISELSTEQLCGSPGSTEFLTELQVFGLTHLATGAPTCLRNQTQSNPFVSQASHSPCL